MARRSKARQVALQMLYQMDLNADVTVDAVKSMIDEQLSDEALQQFAWQLFAGTMEARPQIDDRIESTAENWSLSRMPVTDRNIIRMGTFEMINLETPASVAIDEAIELAKRFGTDQSPQFVNGILDQLVPDSKRKTSADAETEQ